MVPVALNRRLIVVNFYLVLLLASTLGATAGESTPATTIDAFHDALRRGDAKAAMELLAPDAMILESGSAETRAEYERHHLQEDIDFARATTTERSSLKIQQDGNVAWTTAIAKTTGAFKDRKIDSTGVEMIVLTKGDSGWRIRAIHWSSRRNE